MVGRPFPPFGPDYKMSQWGFSCGKCGMIIDAYVPSSPGVQRRQQFNNLGFVQILHFAEVHGQSLGSRGYQQVKTWSETWPFEESPLYESPLRGMGPEVGANGSRNSSPNKTMRQWIGRFLSKSSHYPGRIRRGSR